MQHWRSRQEHDENMALGRFEGRFRLIFGHGLSESNMASWRALDARAQRQPADSAEMAARRGLPDPWLALRDMERWGALWTSVAQSEPRLARWALSCLRLSAMDAGCLPALIPHVAASLACLGSACPWLLDPNHALAFCVALDRCARPRGASERRSSFYRDAALASRCCQELLAHKNDEGFALWSHAFSSQLHPTLTQVDPALGSLIDQLCLADTSDGSRAQARRL
jgi:hypothetical protein